MAKNKSPSALAKYMADKNKERPHRLEYISFRVTHDEKMAIYAKASEMGYKPSDYCRKRCLKQHVPNLSVEAKKERRIFINMANNCNQIARHFNTEGANPQTVAELEQLLADIKKQKTL